MKTPIDKTQEQENTPIQRVLQEPSNGGTAAIIDNRVSTVYQRKLRKMMHASTENSATPIQRKANKTSLPNNLKSGIENLSGYDMDDVKVHYNSSKPTQLQAHAYAQGTNIHLAPGQEKHLPHEAWHVVQQKQGRVKPTMQLKGKVNINDDAGMEKEADVMGQIALQRISQNPHKQNNYYHKNYLSQTIQRKKVELDKLNVIGESHGGIMQEREKAFADSKGLKIWSEEFNFLIKRGRDMLGGESILLRCMWELNNPRVGLETDFLDMFYVTIGPNEKHLKDVYKKNINNEANLAKKLLYIYNRVVNIVENKSFKVKSDKMEEKDLLADYKKLEKEILHTLKNHSYFSDTFFKKFLNSSYDNLMKARSVYMLYHANNFQTEKGIWKIGHSHVADIRNWYPNDNMLPFNLIDKKDWVKELEQWENYQKLL